jgi:hypothetical protein
MSTDTHTAPCQAPVNEAFFAHLFEAEYGPSGGSTLVRLLHLLGLIFGTSALGRLSATYSVVAPEVQADNLQAAKLLYQVLHPEVASFVKPEPIVAALSEAEISAACRIASGSLQTSLCLGGSRMAPGTVYVLRHLRDFFDKEACAQIRLAITPDACPAGQDTETSAPDNTTDTVTTRDLMVACAIIANYIRVHLYKTGEARSGVSQVLRVQLGQIDSEIARLHAEDGEGKQVMNKFVADALARHAEARGVSPDASHGGGPVAAAGFLKDCCAPPVPEAAETHKVSGPAGVSGPRCCCGSVPAETANESEETPDCDRDEALRALSAAVLKMAEKRVASVRSHMQALTGKLP